jgi:DNA-binding beta-propeller fold protein YncE
MSRIIRAATSAALATAALSGTTTAAATAAPYLYAPGSSGAGVAQYAIAADGRLSPISGTLAATGAAPIAIVVSPDAKSVYVVNQTSRTVSQYDVGPNGALTAKAPATVPTGAAPDALAVSPDGKHAYVLNGDDSTLTVYDVDADGELHPRPATVATVASPYAVKVSLDGKNLYVTSPGGTIGQYALAADGTPTPLVPPTVAATGAGPLVLSADGASAYVDSGTTGAVLMFDRLAGGALAAKTPAATTSTDVLGGIDLAPDGQSLYGATSAAPGAIRQLAVGAGGLLTPLAPATVALPSGSGATQARQVTVAPDGDSVYAIDIAGGQIAQYDRRADGTLVAKAPAGVAQNAIAALAVSPQADLSLTTASSATPAAVGQDVTFTLTATNHDGVGVGSARVVTTIPADVTLRSASAGCAGSATVTCDVGPLARGQSRSVTLTVRAARAGTWSLPASVSATAPDPDISNNAATASGTFEERPGATTAPASEVGQDAATLNGVAVTAGTGVTARFELGTTTAYGTTTAAAPVAADGVVSAAATGLSPDTEYHYRLVVDNDQGATVEGADQAFRTAAAPAPDPGPTVVTETVPGPTVTVPVPGPTVTVPGPTVSVPVPGPTVTVVVPAPAAPAADTSRPVLSRVRLSATRLSLRLSEPATIDATIDTGRTRHVRDAGRTRTTVSWARVQRVTLRTTTAGTTTAKLARRLRPGRYRVTTRATDASGNRSRTLTTQITVR